MKYIYTSKLVNLRLSFSYICSIVLCGKRGTMIYENKFENIYDAGYTAFCVLKFIIFNYIRILLVKKQKKSNVPSESHLMK